MEKEEEKFHLIKTGLLALHKVFEDPEFVASYRNISLNKFISLPCCWIRPILVFDNLAFIDPEQKVPPFYPGKVDNIGISAALESLQFHPEIRSRITPRDENISGGYVGMNLFRFWHFGNWISVLIDDRLPYDTQTQKFVYTSTGLPYECWKPLLEKAYAKVLGAYWALEQINILEFLEDISGGITEYFNVKESPQSLLESIIDLAVKKKSIIIGCTSIGPNQQGDGPDLRGSNYFQISIIGKASYKEKEFTILRLRKIFGHFEEDRNFFRHTTEPALAKSKKIEKQIKNDSDPKEFWMTYKDFTIHLDHLFICNLSHDINLHHQHWELSTYIGYWYENISAGGPSKDYACFLTNPQFRILIRGDEKAMPVIVALSQRRIPVFNKKNQLAKYMPFLPIGFTVYKVNIPNNQQLNYRFLSLNNPVYHARYFERREVCVRLYIPQGQYVIIPSTSAPNMESDFLLRVMTQHKSFIDLPWEPKSDSAEKLKGPQMSEKKASKCSLCIQLMPKIIVGQPFDIRVKIYVEVDLDCPLSIFIACNSITNTGRGHRTIKGKEDTVYLEKGQTHETSLTVNFFEYARKRLHEYNFSAFAAVFEQGGTAIIYETKDFYLDLPELFIGYTQSEEIESKFPVESWFVNPLPCAIEYGIFLVESPQLKSKSTLVETGQIGPMARAVAQFEIVPGTPGKYSVTVRFLSKIFNLCTTLELNIYEPEVSVAEETSSFERIEIDKESRESFNSESLSHDFDNLFLQSSEISTAIIPQQMKSQTSHLDKNSILTKSQISHLDKNSIFTKSQISHLDKNSIFSKSQISQHDKNSMLLQSQTSELGRSTLT